MAEKLLLIEFTAGGKPVGQVRCSAVPALGDYVDMGGTQWKVNRRVWTPLSTAETDVIVELL